MMIIDTDDGFTLKVTKEDLAVFADGVQTKLESLNADVAGDNIEDLSLPETAQMMAETDYWWSVYNSLRMAIHAAEEQE